MLRFLGIHHLAVIDQLEVELEPGFNVLTGETGAGKSMIVAAIELLTGGRASSDMVRTGEPTASVQGLFDRGSGDEVVVRREVSAQGRSRAFVDDTLSTTATLRDLGTRLVDIYGQHEHQRLLDPAAHVQVLDAFAEHGALVERTARCFTTWHDARLARERLQMSAREKQLRLEMATFELREIDAVGPEPDEDDRLSAERDVLANADRLSRLSREAYAALYEGEAAALPQLATVWKRIDELAAIDARFRGHAADRDDLKARLEDLADTLRSYAAHLDASPDRLQTVEDRLAALERLKRKWGPSLANVLDERRRLREDVEALGAGEERAAALEQTLRGARDAFVAAASTLSKSRAKAAARLSGTLAAALADLAMPGVRVAFAVRPSDNESDWSAAGADRTEFLLSPNPGEDLRPLERIASGGELSRVMLALRTVAAQDDVGRTLVFDEVDAGIGGEAADAVGARLQALGRTHQVLCITHLPQIAARADAHFRIAKDVRQGRTVTSVERLTTENRVSEVARMMAGGGATERTLASARELIAGAAGKEKAKHYNRSTRRGA